MSDTDTARALLERIGPMAEIPPNCVEPIVDEVAAALSVAREAGRQENDAIVREARQEAYERRRCEEASRLDMACALKRAEQAEAEVARLTAERDAAHKQAEIEHGSLAVAQATVERLRAVIAQVAELGSVTLPDGRLSADSMVAHIAFAALGWPTPCPRQQALTEEPHE